MLLVVAYHFWFGRVSGGVDVFLLISAFLMAGSFTRRIRARKFEGFKSVLAYWVHTFKRIMPLATVTVLGTLLAAFFFLPKSRWLSLISEAKSVIFYYQNWWSIDNLVDYYASDNSLASPLRHFWSLSVQGQIYLLFPLIFLGSALLIRSLGLKVRPTLAAVFGMVFAMSLAYSIYLTHTSQQTAYFNTFARLWEFALGTLVAILLPWVRLTPLARTVLGWLGLVMLVSCGFLFDVEGLFPGYHALWPTLAASFIIAAGESGTKYGPEKLLTLPALLTIGKYSYALYLVHWPLLVIYLAQKQEEKADFVAGIGLFVLSLGLAYLLTRFVEDPLRTWKALEQSLLRGLAVIAACLALVLLPALGWEGKIKADIARAESLAPFNNPGAQSLEANFTYLGAADAEKLPSGTKRTSDWANMGPLCTKTDADFAFEDSLAENCHHPVINTNPTRTVVAVGASHIQMWAPPLIKMAQENNWDLYILSRGACYFGYPGDNSHDARCDDYAQKAYAFTLSKKPDLVLVNSTLSVIGATDQLQQGMESRISELTTQGIRVIGLRDTPRFDQPHARCEEETGADCILPAGQDVAESPSLAYETLYPGYGDVNLSDLVCPENACPSSIGNIYTYFDSHHVSSTYAASTYSFFKTRVDEAILRAETSGASAQTLQPTPATQPSQGGQLGQRGNQQPFTLTNP